MTTAINLDALPSAAFAERPAYPSEPGIYFTLNAAGDVLYIGRAVNIAARWAGHHRAKQLARLGCTRIAWLTVSDPDMLPELEVAMIAHYAPQLNGTPVEDRERVVSVRLSKSEDERLSKAAANIGLKLSQYLRLAALEKAGKE